MNSKISSIIRKDCSLILNNINLEKLKGASILLTGSNGLLGRYLIYTIYFANQIYNLNCKLYGVSLHKPILEFERLRDDKNIIFIQADLTEPFEFNEKIDYIFHAACYAQPKKFLNEKFKTLKLNVDATKTLLEIAKKNRAKFMFFSSVDIYGDIPEEFLPVKESYNGNCSTVAPRSMYGESKRLGETVCSVYRKDCEVCAYIVRISHVYGPGISLHDERVLGNFIRKAFIDKEIRMLDSGSSVKTFGYISDIVLMLLKVMLGGKDFIYNIGGIDSVSIKTLAQEVSKNCGNVPVVVPVEEAKHEHIGTDNKRGRLDISKFIDEFELVNFIPFSEGIKRTVAWNLEESGGK